MRASRILLIAAVAAAGLLLLVAVAAFCAPVQTWAARKAIDSIAPPGSSIGRLSVGWSQMTLSDLRLERSGSVLVVPEAEAQLGVFAAVFGRGYLVKSLVAKGWTLDLTLSRAAEAPRPSIVPPGAESSRVARALGGMLAAFNVPAGLSLEAVDLEGRVVLPDQRGRQAGTATVVVTGGGLAAGRDGNFLCVVGASLDDPAAPVSSVAIRATLGATMDRSGTFTRADLRADATARGLKFPEGVGLSCAARAARGTGKISYSFSLIRGTERIASIDAENPDGSNRMEGAWQLDMKDTDLAPFALGRQLPEFHVAGTGTYELDASTGDLHAAGKAQASADRLGLVSPTLAGLGSVEFTADFDVARKGDSLRVDRLETSLSAAAPVAAVRALQPFEFNAATGELKVSHPSGDLVGISVGGAPLSWLNGSLSRIDLSGDAAHGEFVIRAEDGRLVLRTRAPLRASSVSVAFEGRPVASGLEISAFVLGDYSPQGWQLELAPLDVRSEGIEALSLEARLGRLAGTGQEPKAEGSWSVSVPAMMSQPFAARLPRFTGGDASGTFEASLGPTLEVRSRLALRALALASGGPASLPEVTSDIRADFDESGQTTFAIPLHLDYGSRAVDIGLSGTISERDGVPIVGAKLLGGRISADEIGLFAALYGGPGPDAPADGSPAPRPDSPFWPRARGALSVRLESLELPGVVLGDARMTLVLDPAFLEIQDGSANFGDASSARMDGKLTFERGAERPYSCLANLQLANVDSTPLFRAIDPDRPAAIEGRFDLSGRLTASGAAPAELLMGAQGGCKLSSRDGKFRALRTEAMEAIKQAPSKLVDALDSVTSLFGKRQDKVGEALVASASGLSEIHYDQMNLSAERGADLDIRFTELSLIAPEERMTGTGRITHVEGVPIQAQPLSLDLEMGVRGRIEKFLGIVGMLQDGKDELGYTRLYQPIHLGGTLQHIDQSQWRDMLVQAPLRKGGGLIDKLLSK